MAASQPYLEMFLDSLENLSPELTRNFKLIYDLDVRIQNASIEIDGLKSEYLANSKSMDNEARQAQLKIINRKYEKINQLSDEKVQLANQSYEMVRFALFKSNLNRYLNYINELRSISIYVNWTRI